MRNIWQTRREIRLILFLDETWIYAEYTISKDWQDDKVTRGRQAFLDGLSKGLNPPSAKGKRLIILHIGSSEGFVDSG